MISQRYRIPCRLQVLQRRRRLQVPTVFDINCRYDDMSKDTVLVMIQIHCCEVQVQLGCLQIAIKLRNRIRKWDEPVRSQIRQSWPRRPLPLPIHDSLHISDLRELMDTYTNAKT